MLYTLKVYPNGLGKSVYRVLKISGNETLDTLCGEILDSFNFDNDHLYEFCMDNKMYSEDSYRLEPQYGERSTNIEISGLGLCEKQKFLLHYDFGDDWMFTIAVQNIQEASVITEPYIVKSKGNIEQYPNWDDEWEQMAETHILSEKNIGS